MRRRTNVLIGFLFALVCSGASLAANNANIVAFPTLASVQNVGSSAPNYPDIFVVSYTSSGGGANFHWNSPCPSAVAGIAQISITGVSTGCYVQAIPVSAALFTASRTVTSSSSLSDRTLSAGDTAVRCDSTAGDVRIVAPPGVGSSALVKTVRIIKVSAANLCSISSDNVTDFSYIINVNDAGGAGWLDVGMNGSSDTSVGVP